LPQCSGSLFPAIRRMGTFALWRSISTIYGP
jgi:hypothetical protein